MQAAWPNEIPFKERLVSRNISTLLIEGTDEYEEEIFRQILAAFFILVTTIFIIGFSANPAYSNEPEEKLYSLNIYAGQMTTDGIGRLLIHFYDPDFKNSYLTAVTLARRIGTYKKMASFEVEGQVVKHFNIQDQGIRLLCPETGQPLFTVARDDDVIPRFGQTAVHQSNTDRIIINDQDFLGHKITPCSLC